MLVTAVNARVHATCFQDVPLRSSCRICGRTFMQHPMPSRWGLVCRPWFVYWQGELELIICHLVATSSLQRAVFPVSTLRVCGAEVLFISPVIPLDSLVGWINCATLGIVSALGGRTVGATYFVQCTGSPSPALLESVSITSAVLFDHDGSLGGSIVRVWLHPAARMPPSLF